MEVVFIRHGEPNYLPCDERGFIGQGRDLAPLTDDGVKQAEALSNNKVLCGCEIIVSSPYTRALQTAAIISKNTEKNIKVEVDLHEWIPDKTYQYKSSEQSFELHKTFWDNKGVYPNGEEHRWETIPEIIERVVPVLNKYLRLGYKKIAIVAHGGVIRRFYGDSEIDYCTPYVIEYNTEFQCIGWVD